MATKPAASLSVISPTTGEIIPFNERSLGNCQLTPVSLTLPDNLPFEEWIKVGEALHTFERSIQWAIGDWWAYGEHNYGDRKQTLEAMRQAGVNVPGFQACMDLAFVSGRFKTTSRRREVLSHSHHREVAKLEPRDADWFLDRAESNGWSHKALRDEVRRYQRELVQRPGEKQYPTQTLEDLHALVDAGREFGTIYADPPWPYGNQATRASTKNHYKAHDDLSIEDICNLPVPALSAPNAHCHLWTTNGFLREAFDVMAAWGFTYKSCFVWTKPDFGLGNYWRVGHEFMLFGLKGKAPFGDNSQTSWIHEQAGEHSAKPPKVRRLIEKVSPGPYLELFARREVEGWTAWGNEIPKDPAVQMSLADDAPEQKRPSKRNRQEV